MPPPLELGAQALEVVDLAVQDHGDGLVLVEDRLAAGDEIDDAEPAVAEGGPAVGRHVQARPIGSAVRDGVRHRANRAQIDIAIRAESDLPGDATHGRLPFSIRRHRQGVRVDCRPHGRASGTRRPFSPYRTAARRSRAPPHPFAPLPRAPAGPRRWPPPCPPRPEADHHAGPPVPDHAGHPADVGDDDRLRARHRFEEGQRHALVHRGQDEDVHGRQEHGHVGAVAEKADACRSALLARDHALQLLPHGPVANDDEAARAGTSAMTERNAAINVR